MRQQRMKTMGLDDLVDSFQARGRYTFTRDDALGVLELSDNALKKAVRRLVDKRRLAVPRRGFFVIVPLEYRSAGAPPPSWFIDDLMKFHEQPYYVGLLSAAAIHGAGHQQPMEFQVVTSTQLRPTVIGRARLRFFTKRHLGTTPTMAVQTETGSMRLSTPEATAFDLVRYVKRSGDLDNVATVLTELGERMEARLLVEAADADTELPVVQRLGYLLDWAGHVELVKPLAEWVAEQRPRSVLLRPGRAPDDSETNRRWHVKVNERVESDL